MGMRKLECSQAASGAARGTHQPERAAHYVAWPCLSSPVPGVQATWRQGLHTQSLGALRMPRHG